MVRDSLEFGRLERKIKDRQDPEEIDEEIEEALYSNDITDQQEVLLRLALSKVLNEQ